MVTRHDHGSTWERRPDPVKVEPDLHPVIDIGSGVQIETDGERALEMLDQRNRELEGLIQNLLLEIKQADEAIIDMEKQMMELNEKSKTTEELPPNQGQNQRPHSPRPSKEGGRGEQN